MIHLFFCDIKLFIKKNKKLRFAIEMKYYFKYSFERVCLYYIIRIEKEYNNVLGVL